MVYYITVSITVLYSTDNYKVTKHVSYQTYNKHLVINNKFNHANNTKQCPFNIFFDFMINYEKYSTTKQLEKPDTKRTVRYANVSMYIGYNNFN